MNKLITTAAVSSLVLSMGCGPDDDGGGGTEKLWYADADGDSQGNPTTEISAVESPGSQYVENGTDCDDDNDTVYLGAAELCDGEDNSCDGNVPSNETDDDTDGYVECLPWVGTDEAITGDDCDDADGNNFPDNPEVPDGFDNDCDGMADNGLVAVDWYRDLDLDGYGDPNDSIYSIIPPPYYAPLNGDCNDNNAAINPGATEIIDGTFTDENCDGIIADETVNYVFITSTTSGGNLGGLDGADATCQSQADDAGLPGNYKAWLSDSTTSAASRLTHSTVSYVTPDGSIVATDWDEWTDGSSNVVWAYPDGSAPNPSDGFFLLLTGTEVDGGRLVSNAQFNCADWTTDTTPSHSGQLVIGIMWDPAAGRQLKGPRAWTAYEPAGASFCWHVDATYGTTEKGYHLLCMQQ